MIKTNYIIKPYKKWYNNKTGQSASIYGSLPYFSNNINNEWQIITSGYTVYNTKTNTSGIGRKPFKTLKDAENWLKG